MIKKIKAIVTGKAQLDPDMLKEIQHPFRLIKENWILFLVIALAFSCGWVLAANYYQTQCNKHIIETFYKDEFNLSEMGIDFQLVGSGEFHNKTNVTNNNLAKDLNS